MLDAPVPLQIEKGPGSEWVLGRFRTSRNQNKAHGIMLCSPLSAEQLAFEVHGPRATNHSSNASAQKKIQTTQIV